MKLLAIECSSAGSLSVAALENGVLVRDWGEQAMRRHVERLAPLVDETINDLGWKARDLAAVAVSLGPGSFTGLRSSLAFAKGLCFANQAALLGIVTLDAWGWMEREGDCQVWLDAGKAMVYRAAYAKGSRALEPSLVSLEQAQSELPAGMKVIGDLPGGGGVDAPPAMAVAHLAWARLERGEADDAVTLEPYYLRRAEAEVLWEKRHGA